MSSSSETENNEQRLERLIQKTLRDLPSRRAPGTLEHRVLVELERRAALPWWRKSYVHWPLPARCLFLLGAGGVAKAVLMVFVWVLVGFETAPFAEAFATSSKWLHSIADLGSSVLEFGGAVLSTLSPLWIYGGIVCIAATYALLFGLGAFAYRTLRTSR